MEVKLIDSMGSDVTVVNAARVSFKKIVPDGILREKDIRLIKYLTEHGHWTPLAHIAVTLHLKMPIFIARQFAKHTVGLVINEVSRRYVDDPPEFFVPDAWRLKPEGSIKQGSSDRTITHLELDEHLVWDDPTSPKLTASIDSWYHDAFNLCHQLYDQMIKNGVAPEQARMVLPQSMYTEMYTTGSLVAWARIFKLRSDPHAQKEIQDLAQMIDIAILSRPEMKHSWMALRS